MTERLEHLHPELEHVPVEVFNALVDVVNTLCDGATLYEAHVENLIERVYELEQKTVTPDDSMAIAERLRAGDQTTYRTKTGKILTDADIEALADEAEAGYDVEHLKGKPLRREPPQSETL